MPLFSQTARLGRPEHSMKRIGTLSVRGGFFRKSGKFWTLRTDHPEDETQENQVKKRLWKAKGGDLIYVMRLDKRYWDWTERIWRYDWNSGRVLVGHANNTGFESINKVHTNQSPVCKYTL